MLKLTLLPDVRATLQASLRLADLVRIDFSEDFSLKIKEEDLIDYDLVELMRTRLESTPAQGALSLSDPEMVFWFGLLDILCKSYFTAFADVLEKEYQAQTRANDFLDQRSRILSTATRLLAKFKELTGKRASFAEQEDKLATLQETMRL